MQILFYTWYFFCICLSKSINSPKQQSSWMQSMGVRPVCLQRLTWGWSFEVSQPQLLKVSQKILEYSIVLTTRPWKFSVYLFTIICVCVCYPGPWWALAQALLRAVSVSVVLPQSGSVLKCMAHIETKDHEDAWVCAATYDQVSVPGTCCQWVHDNLGDLYCSLGHGDI